MKRYALNFAFLFGWFMAFLAWLAGVELVRGLPLLLAVLGVLLGVCAGLLFGTFFGEAVVIERRKNQNERRIDP